MRWLSRFVTVGIVVAIVVAVALLIRSRMPTMQVGGGFKTYAMFRDGSRLAVGSPVVIAGVRVGDVTRLSIEGGMARVDMRLRDDIELPVDSFATRRADSLFGDSYVEIIPGTGDVGAGPVRYLESGERIPNVQEGASTDTVLRAMERALPQVDNALETIHGRAIDGRQWVQGPMNEALQHADDWLQEGRIEGPITAADRAFERLEGISQAAADSVDRADINGTFRRWNATLTQTRQDIAQAQLDMASGFRSTREAFDGIDEPFTQYAEIVGAIDRGEGEGWKGTLGRLVNDPALADSIEEGVVSVREGVSGYNRFRSWLGARVELGAYSRAFRFYATAEIRARNDKFYLVELERSALGGLPADQLSDAANTSAYTRTQQIRDKLRFTAQFGKQFGFLQLRGGLKDSTFGVGSDLLFLDGRLRFSADLFGSFSHTPRLKLAGAFAVFESIYILAGVDDALNEPGYLDIVTGNTEVPAFFDELRYGRDYFVGAALHFTDADLATLLRVYGALLVGML